MHAVPSVADKIEEIRKLNDLDIVVAMCMPVKLGMSKEFEARRHLSLLIENTRVAYRYSLQTPVDEIDKALHARLAYLFITHFSIRQKEECEIFNFQSGVGKMINSFPFARGLPRLESLISTYAQTRSESPDVFRGHSALVCFRGTFAYAGDTRYQPTFEIDGRTLNPETASVKELDFRVPFKSPKNQCKYVPCKLRVPFETSWFG